MWRKARIWLRNIGWAAIALMIIIPAIFAILTVLLVSLLIVIMTSVSAGIGAIFPIDRWVRSIMHRQLDINRMEEIRDDSLEIFRRSMTIPTDYDEYWMLREIDLAKDRIDSKLRNGMILLTIVAGLTSIGLAFFSPIEYAGVVLTIFVIGLALSTFWRFIIIEILAFDSRDCEEEPYEDIVLRMGWNRGPINGRGAVLLAFVTALTGVHKKGYDIGMWLLESILDNRYSDGCEYWVVSK